MNTTVNNKFFKGDSCNLPSYGIKSRKNNRFRSIVDNKIDSGKCFKGADISSFTTDNTAFHLIIRKLDNRNRCFRNMVYGTALNGIGNDITALTVSLMLSLCFCLFYHYDGLMFNVIFYHCKKIIFSFFRCKT